MRQRDACFDSGSRYATLFEQVRPKRLAFFVCNAKAFGQVGIEVAPVCRDRVKGRLDVGLLHADQGGEGVMPEILSVLPIAIEDLFRGTVAEQVLLYDLVFRDA